MEVWTDRLRLAAIIIAVSGASWLLLGEAIFAILGFVCLIFAILGVLFLLDKLSERNQALVTLAVVALMGVNIAVHGKASLSYRIVAGTLTGLFGGSPSCSGPMEWRCDSD